MESIKKKQRSMIDGPETWEQLRGTNVLIVGLAGTGIAAARFLLKHGCRVAITERRRKEDVEGILQELNTMDIQWELGGHHEKTFLDKDWILVSPGVPMDIPPLVKARSEGIPILSDIELAFRLTSTPVIAITGTNGKTTTTTLLGEILKADGRKTFVGGNIGTPILNAFDQDIAYDFWVVEVSSFQLEGTIHFAPHIAVILNLTPDHLDRYRSMSEYQQAKARILRCQTAGDYAILNVRDPWVFGLAHECVAKAYLFDSKAEVTQGAGMREGRVIMRNGCRQMDLCTGEEMGLCGTHNMENIMAASVAAYLVGASDEIIRHGVRTFKGLPHRIEKIRDIGGVRFINDSKGTNIDAVIKAIESIDTPIILIAGGQDKGCDFRPIAGLVRERVKAVFLIGEAKSRIARALGSSTEIVESEDLRSAIQGSYRMAKPGYTVLLSPGCASFDMFKDYKDRGNQFKRLVMELEDAEKKLF